MHDFLMAFLGGTLLGVAAVGYLYINGRITGISGMLGQVLRFEASAKAPASWFLAGLILTPIIYGLFFTPEVVLAASPLMMVIAGLLVGFGTRLGSGCTSGHGICGISRLSMRSLIATLTFMAAGVATVFVMRHVIGGF